MSGALASGPTDLDLLQRIAVRDDTALATLYDRYSSLAYGVILRVLRSPSDAEDVLQETFVRVWSRAETYDSRLGSPAAWLTRIARNRAIDRLRARLVRRHISVEADVTPDGDTTLPEPHTHETPEVVAQGQGVARALRTTMAALPAAQRALIEAAFFEGYTHPELAARFGMPLGTVKTRIRAGLMTMRGRLEQIRMIPEDVEALALADAVGALEPAEQAELASLVAALTPEARAAVAGLYDATVMALAASVPPQTPPARVRERVLAQTRTPGRYTLSASADDWFDTPVAGIRGRVLAVDRAKGTATLLLRAEPGAVYPSHTHHGSEECYVLRGSIVVDGRTLHAGDFHHADDDSDHGEIMTVEGADVLIVGAIEDYLPGF